MAQRHRGPDDHGVEVVCEADAERMSVIFGSSRLAILDLSKAGHQPMHDTTTGNWIVQNGEIYNFVELRSELEAKGERFLSGTDTEVMLLSYKVWGREAVHRWRGMFACAIWDSARREVVLMRDRLGVKPLYWTTGAEGAVLFSSEVRALLSSGLVDCRIDPEGVSSFLTSGAVRAPATMIRNVRSLRPASCMSISIHGDVMSGPRYWNLARRDVEVDECYSNAVIKARSLLQDAVEAHLVSDVPVSVFLSGGVDSSAIVALASRVATTQIKTFSVTFQDPTISEAGYSREVAKKWETEHSEIVLAEQDIRALIEDAVECMDQPSVDGINTFLISRCAKQAGVKVALSGLGGDEVFGGYSTFRRVPRLAKFGNMVGWLPVGMRNAAEALSGAIGGLGAKQRLAAFAAGKGDMLSSYLMLRMLLTSGQTAVLTGRSSASVLESCKEDDQNLRARIQGLDPFRQVSLLEMEMYMSNMLLRDTDVMSMANSLEVRVPFLDHRLVEYVWSLPMEVKCRTGKPKGFLLDAMGRDLPASVVNRDKRGFTFPWAEWMRGVLRDQLEEVFIADSPVGGDVIDRKEQLRIWREFLSSNDDRMWSRVWAVYILRRWLERLAAAKGTRSSGLVSRAGAC